VYDFCQTPWLDSLSLSQAQGPALKGQGLSDLRREVVNEQDQM
jgi:hypothetical protein